MKPKVFIGSSREAIPAAEAIQQALDDLSETELWSQGLFKQTNVPIEDLMVAVSRFDFAVFVFLPEDYAEIRGERELTVRDNVLFELGLFLGKLGRQRVFFIAPVGKQVFKVHLPTDLSGLRPSMYDADASNRVAAIGKSLYEAKEAIRTLGSVDRQETVLYDGRKAFKPYHFEHRNANIWKDDKPVSAKGEGTLTVLPDSSLRILRTNKVGRNELTLLQNGPDKPSIVRKHDLPRRVLHITFEVRVEGGAHTLRFVAKDIATKEWADNKKILVKNTSWTTEDVYLRIPSTADFWLRIDDEDVEVAPSSVFIKNVMITEEG